MSNPNPKSLESSSVDLSFVDDIASTIPTNTKNTIQDKPFWSENPNILLQNPDELFPIDSMTYNQKLNAVTRLVVILSIVGFFMTYSIRLLIVSVITILSIWLLHSYKTNTEMKKKKVRFSDSALENFDNITDSIRNNSAYPTENVFLPPSSTNPFGNVLMTDYDYNPNKKPAPPSFNGNVNTNIIEKVKEAVSDMNPDYPKFSEKLYHDLGEQYTLEQSMRQFVSNPSTTIPNDQTSFAEFCYGSMISCKEGNQFACARNLSRYTNV
jgi:hypothetical protein